MFSNLQWYFQQAEMIFFRRARHSLLKWHNSLSAHCVWADRWRVLSRTTYSALWQLRQQITKAEDDKWRFSHLSPGLTKQHSPVQAWNHVWREILYVWKKKKSSCVAEQVLRKHTHSSALWFWALFLSVCVQNVRRCKPKESCQDKANGTVTSFLTCEFSFFLSLINSCA